MRTFQTIVLCFTLSLLAGCSFKSSEADARKRVEQEIQQNSNGFIKLIDFRKTNGKDVEFAGVKVYEMEWVANLEFTGDCMWNTSNFHTIPPLEGINLLFHQDKKKAQKGQRVDLSGSTTFEKTEKGWR
jgi:hypothetical protein